jgi:hypothetical protein
MATSSKVISFRLPLDEYIEVLKDAEKAKMTLSDYVLIKVVTALKNKTIDFAKGGSIDKKDGYIKETEMQTMLSDKKDGYIKITEMYSRLAGATAHYQKRMQKAYVMLMGLDTPQTRITKTFLQESIDEAKKDYEGYNRRA